MSRLKPIVFYLAISIILNWLCHILQSFYFAEYLRGHILEILITLMAINTATTSVVITKLHEISIKEQVPLGDTINEVKVSLVEQICLIAASVIILILYHSPVISDRFLYHEPFFNILIVTVFIYAIDILRDTGMAIFEIIKHSQRPKK